MSKRQAGASLETLSSEASLLLRCACPFVDERTKNEIARLIEGEVDWARFVEMTLWHQVVELVCGNLDDPILTRVPGDVVEDLKRHRRRERFRAQLLTDELIKLHAALERERIPVIFFKGPSLSQTLYGSVTRRSFSDLDFLIQQSDIDRTLDVVARESYPYPLTRTPAQERSFRRNYGQYKIVRDDGRAVIEPHWLFTPSVLALDIDYASIWRRAASMTLRGARIPVLAPRDVALTLCLHGSKERWYSLKCICDVAALLATQPELDWEPILDDARARGFLRMVLLGPALAKQFLAAQLPPALAQAVARDPSLPDLIARVQRLVFSDAPGPPSNQSVNGFRVKSRERWRDKFRYAVRTSTVPREHHFDIVALPDFLFFLYYPIRWVHDYALLPVWRLLRPTAR